MKLVKSLIAGASLLAASQTMAVTVSGVTWDESFDGQNADFTGVGSFEQNLVAGQGELSEVPTLELEGFGIMGIMNDRNGDFCLSCQNLTYTFTDFTAIAFDGGGRPTDFTGGFINVYKDYDVIAPTTIGEASDGDLWLTLQAVTLNDTLTTLSLTYVDATNKVYSAAAFDVVSGVAAYNFDTDSKVWGSGETSKIVDFLFDGSITFLETSGSITLKGESIPVPAPLALLGLGLVALGLRARKA